MQSTPWGCFVTITSKSLYRFVINGAEQALLFSLPEKGWQVLFCSFSYDLLNNCRVFSLFFSSLKITTKDDISSIIFMSSFTSDHFSSPCLFLCFYMLEPIGYPASVPCMFVLFFDAGSEKAKRWILFCLQSKDESNLPSWFSCWMGVRRLKYCLLSTRIIILPTSMPQLSGEKEHKMKLKMFVLSLEKRWKLHNFSLLPFAPLEVRLGQHMQFQLLFPEVNNSAVRLQSQLNIWQSCCLEIIPLVHIYIISSPKGSQSTLTHWTV